MLGESGFAQAAVMPTAVSHGMIRPLESRIAMRDTTKLRQVNQCHQYRPSLP